MEIPKPTAGEVSITCETTLEENLNCRNMLQDHINFGYYTLLYPFKAHSREPTCYVLQRNWIQKILCIFVHICVFIFSVLYVQAFTKVEISEKPNALFLIAEGGSEIGRCYVFLATIWLKKKDLLEALPKFSKKVDSKVLIGTYILHVFIFLRAISSVIYYDFLTLNTGNGNSSMFEKAVIQARYILLLDPYEEDKVSWDETRNMDIVTITVFYTLVLAKEIVTQYADSLFWVLSIFAFLSCQKLKRVTKLSESEKHDVTKQFKETRSLLDSANAILSVYVLLKFLSLVPLYSGDGFNIFEDAAWGHRILFLSYVITSFGPFFVAAEAHYRISRTVCGQFSGEALQLLMGYRFFTITYGFIGSTCAIVITYAILVLQFNISSCSPSK